MTSDFTKTYPQVGTYILPGEFPSTLFSQECLQIVFIDDFLSVLTLFDIGSFEHCGIYYNVIKFQNIYFWTEKLTFEVA